MPKRPPKPGSPVRPKKKFDKTIDEVRQLGAKKTRRDLELTDTLAQHMAIMWTHNLTDEVIYTSLGIPKRTFYKWLELNRIVSVEITLGKDRSTLTLGLRELKERMKAFFEPKYLVRLENLIDKAESDADYRTASSNLRWLMMKRLPRKYGREADSRIGIDQIEMICSSIFQIIFRHVKDPVLLSKIQDDFDRLKAEEELKLHTAESEDAAADLGELEDVDQETEKEVDS